MTLLATCSPHALLDLQDAAREAARAQATVESALRVALCLVRESLAESVPLLRAYATIPHGELPPDDARFAGELARIAGLGDVLTPATTVLSLMATCGALPEWNDRRLSQGHRAIPLLSAEFVGAAPMVSRLLLELGVEMSWLEGGDSSLVTRHLGATWVGVFHVADARTARDARGRLVIPAQGFVAEHGVRTVFGLGVAWSTGSILSVIAFTRESLTREQCAELVPLARVLKVATADMASAGALYDP